MNRGHQLQREYVRIMMLSISRISEGYVKARDSFSTKEMKTKQSNSKTIDLQVTVPVSKHS